MNWEDQYAHARVRPPYLTVVLCSALISATTVVVLSLVMDNVSGGGKLSVPALVGLAPAQAGATISAVGLIMATGGQVQDPVIERGKVARQTPLAGVQARPGQVVTITLSRGPDQVTVKAVSGPSQAPPPSPPRAVASRPAARKAAGTVPKVTGIRMKYAISRLRSGGLLLGRISYRSDEDHMEEYVLSQSPAAGAPCTRGDRVNLVVNRLE